MIQIFTIQFRYLNEDQYALIKVSIKEDEPNFYIQFHNCALDPIILSNHLQYTGLYGYKHMDLYKNEEAKELMDSIGQKIENQVAKALTSKKVL